VVVDKLSPNPGKGTESQRIIRERILTEKDVADDPRIGSSGTGGGGNPICETIGLSEDMSPYGTPFGMCRIVSPPIYGSVWLCMYPPRESSGQGKKNSDKLKVFHGDRF